jgi:hypothetical protein
VLSETLNLPNINVIDSFHFEVSVIVQTVNDNDIKKQGGAYNNVLVISTCPLCLTW